MSAVSRRVLTILVLVCIPTVARAEQPETAEVEWARGIAEDFWRAVLSGTAEQAAGLLSPELSKSLVTYDRVGFSDHLREWPAHKWMSLRLPTGPGVSVVFDAAKLSPDRSEVAFRGRLSGKDHWDYAVASEFSMRVAKEQGGKWVIRYFLVSDGKEAGGKNR